MSKMVQIRNVPETLHRKLSEMLFAMQLERHFTKEEILELYLNKVYFGDGLYGAEAASRGYFAKSASNCRRTTPATSVGRPRIGVAGDVVPRPPNSEGSAPSSSPPIPAGRVLG